MVEAITVPAGFTAITWPSPGHCLAISGAGQPGLLLLMKKAKGRIGGCIDNQPNGRNQVMALFENIVPAQASVFCKEICFRPQAREKDLPEPLDLVQREFPRNDTGATAGCGIFAHPSAAPRDH